MTILDKRLTRSVVAWFIDYYKLDRYKFDVDVVCKDSGEKDSKDLVLSLVVLIAHDHEIEIHNGLEEGRLLLH